MANNVIKVVAGLGTASVIAVSGAALASSQTSPSASAPSSTSKPTPQPGGHQGGMRHGTPVTGATLTSVTNAVKAKDSAVTVKVVFKDADGSYDALGTKAGKPVHVDVSKDFKTVTVKTGFAGRGGPGGHGMHRGTAVSGTELTSVKTAVKAKDSAVTVERVFKESDGTYHAMGTKAGQRVHVEVSKDLKTVTVKTGGPGAHGPRGGHGPAAKQAPSSSASASTAPTA